MNHLIINREYPPCSYPPGGIGTYVDHISRLLARCGETVHVIGQLWPGAPRRRESRMNGRLIVHRVPLDEPLPHEGAGDAAILRAFKDSLLPVQAFTWQAARLAESLIDSEAIDIIEAQEYEAPLYFLLLRRALGLSTARRVPVIVHLHTGTEFVFAQNDWDQSRVDYLPAKRLEDYTIRAADALLCPSQFLARIAQQHYHLETGSIEVIPYPIGNTAVLAREPDTWTNGTICYIGRLEPRKGVAEWIEAAVAVATSDPGPHFSLVGGDTPYSGDGNQSTRDVLQARIPAALRPRFTFVDFVPREQLAPFLARARMAVVPSRWENFPNTCIEAMSSGLPVLASPTGGMAEMIEDGRTGWIAAGPDPQSLEVAFRRALSTPPPVIAEMGAAAAVAVRVLCDNEETVRRQLEFRRRVVSRGCPRSTEVVASSTDGPVTHPEISRRSGTPRGIGLIVRSRRGKAAAACIDSILSQTVQPSHVVLIVPPDARIPERRPPADSWTWQIVRHPDVGSTAAHNEALQLTMAVDHVRAVTLIDDDCTLSPDYVATIDRVFTHCPTVGIVTPWHREDGQIHIGLPPAFPYQSAWNDVGPCAAFRLAAVEDPGGQPSLTGNDAIWDLCNRVLGAGWRAAPFPAALASLQGDPQRARTQQTASADVLPVSGRTLTPLEVLLATPQQQLELFRRALADPAYLVRWLVWHARGAIVRVSHKVSPR